jgi:CheY-like chemotaxis protein
MGVLVIEDDDSVRSAVRRALLLDGFEVLAAPTGQEGVLKVETVVPDAIILDLGLPDIDGIEVCRRLRSVGNRAPILMLTAREAVEDRVEGLAAGAGSPPGCVDQCPVTGRDSALYRASICVIHGFLTPTTDCVDISCLKLTRRSR